MLKKQRSLQIDKITVDKLPSVPEFCIFHPKYEIQKVQYRCSSQKSLF